VTLREALRHLADVPVLLVATDFDGVLAPLVSDPETSRPLPAAADALRELAALPDTTVALLSGRDLATLARLSGLGGEAVLIGTHGAEFDDGLALPAAAVALRDRVLAAVKPLVADVAGASVEVKPASVAVHVRNADRDAGDRLLAAVAEGPGGWDGVHSTAGKRVLELAVIETSKGTAIETLRDQVGASAVFFAGDDVTDEKAFAVLGEGDVGVKVGEGSTAAQYRVADPEAMIKVFALLAEERRQHTGT
jgi:trehalose 6-phosphate phosphatase